MITFDAAGFSLIWLVALGATLTGLIMSLIDRHDQPVCSICAGRLDRPGRLDRALKQGKIDWPED